MDTILEDVSVEYARKNPGIEVYLDKEEDLHAHVHNLYRVEAVKMLYFAIDMLTEGMDHEEHQEIDDWLAED